VCGSLVILALSWRVIITPSESTHPPPPSEVECPYEEDLAVCHNCIVVVDLDSNYYYYIVVVVLGIAVVVAVVEQIVVVVVAV